MDCTLINVNINTCDANSCENKPKYIIDVPKYLDATFDEACQNHNISKIFDTGFKEVDKSDNE